MIAYGICLEPVLHFFVGDVGEEVRDFFLSGKVFSDLLLW